MASCHTHAATCYQQQVFPQNSLTESSAEKSLPQIAQMSTDYWGRRSPTEFTVPSAVFCEFCGRKLQQESSVSSVKSVGETTARNFCEFCEFCGRKLQQETSVKSVKSVGEYYLLGWCT